MHSSSRDVNHNEFSISEERLEVVGATWSEAVEYSYGQTNKETDVRNLCLAEVIKEVSK